MKRAWIQGLRVISYTFAALAAVGVSGVFGLGGTSELMMSPAPAALAAPAVPQPAPTYDPGKPTVAVLLSNTQTEATDFLAPYAMFSESGAYNVYAVAETRDVRTLAGGVDVLPQRSFAELAALLPNGPDIILVPAMTRVRSPENASVLAWLRQQGQGQTLLFAWCVGAEVLAESGLLDGTTATTHWGQIDDLERAYPQVHWRRGERYIDAGTLLTTGGITSGVDATLHLLARRNGQAVADRVARALHYPGSPFVVDPHLTQYTYELADSPLILNAAFNWPKRRAGAWLYDGVSEFDLAAVVDVYAISSAYRVDTLAAAPAVVSQHGLQILPRWQTPTLPPVTRLLIPGGEGVEQAIGHLPEALRGGSVPITMLHQRHAPTYAFTLALQDLAQTHNVATAVASARRLEVRLPLQLVGPRWPFQLLIIPLLAGLGGTIALAGLSRLGRRIVGRLRRSR